MILCLRHTGVNKHEWHYNINLQHKHPATFYLFDFLTFSKLERVWWMLPWSEYQLIFRALLFPYEWILHIEIRCKACKLPLPLFRPLNSLVHLSCNSLRHQQVLTASTWYVQFQMCKAGSSEFGREINVMHSKWVNWSLCKINWLATIKA